MLRDKAEEMRLDTAMPPRVRQRARGRRVLNASVSGVIVVGVAIAALAGSRQLLGNDRATAPRPAVQPDAPAAAQPIWPLGRPQDMDRIQLEVDRGHQPWYLSPEVVAQVFAMDFLSWDREDIEASVRGDDPVQVVISNPTLTEAAGISADIRTVLTMQRWRNRSDGIFVITRADSDVVDVRAPKSGQDLEGTEQFNYSGTVSPVGQELWLELSLVHLVLGHEEDPLEIRPLPAIQPGAQSGQSVFKGGAPVSAPLPDWLTFMALIGDDPTNPNRLAIEAFRVGSGYPLPPPPADERLPAPVSKTLDAIQVAANDRDWDALEALIEPSRFEFTFGGGRDPIAYWKRLERAWAGGEAGGVPVLRILSTLLGYPGTEYMDLYVWPSAAAKEPNDWTEADLEPLSQIYSEDELAQIRQADSYYGWRVGIEPDGTWVFFVAGD